jgi:hypothetical protein
MTVLNISFPPLVVRKAKRLARNFVVTNLKAVP